MNVECKVTGIYCEQCKFLVRSDAKLLIEVAASLHASHSGFVYIVIGTKGPEGWAGREFTVGVSE